MAVFNTGCRGVREVGGWLLVILFSAGFDEGAIVWPRFCDRRDYWVHAWLKLVWQVLTTGVSSHGRT